MSLSACVETEALRLPEGTGGRSIIYVVALGEDPVLIWAAEGGTGLPVSLHQDQDLYALSYEATLEELALVPGKIDRVDDEPARRLPERGAIAVARGGSGARSFEALAEKNAVLDAILIPGFAPEACERARGCFLFDEGVARCEVPCLRPNAPAEPTPPSPPIFTPCPAWWTAVPLNGAADAPVICEPPEDPRSVLGPECAADGWPVLEANANARYVRAGAPAGGDGSKAAPFDTIAAALAGAPDAVLIALSIGVHAGVSTERTVRVIGACASGTSIEDTMYAGSLEGSLHLENLEVERATAVAGRLVLRSVIVRGGGVLIDRGGTLDAEDVFVEGSASQDGIRVRLGSSATIKRAALAGVAGTAVGVRLNATAMIEDLAIRTTQNIALVVDEGSQASIARASIRGAVAFAVHVDAASADLRDLVTERTSRHPVNEHSGEGVVFDGSIGSLRRAWIEDSNGRGIAAAGFRPGTGSDLRIEDLTIRKVGVRTGPGRGIEALHRSAIHVSRARIEDVEGEGVWILTTNATTSHSLEDLRIARSGRPGIEVHEGNFSLARAAIDEAGGAAVNIFACEARDIDGAIEDLSVGTLIARPNDIYCGDDLPPGTGIGIALRGCVPRTDVRVPISRFLVSTRLDASIGVCVGLAADSTLSSGVVSDNDVGLLVGELRRAKVGRDVIFEHNRSGSFHVLD